MKRRRTKAQIKKELLTALERSLGVVSAACSKVQIDRGTFYNYYKDDKDFKSKVDEINNTAIDFAETNLFKQIKNGNATSTIFYLKTKGKSRGYIERQEIDATMEVQGTIADMFKPKPKK